MSKEQEAVKLQQQIDTAAAVNSEPVVRNLPKRVSVQGVISSEVEEIFTTEKKDKSFFKFAVTDDMTFKPVIVQASKIYISEAIKLGALVLLELELTTPTTEFFDRKSKTWGRHTRSANVVVDLTLVSRVKTLGQALQYNAEVFREQAFSLMEGMIG